MSGRDASPQTAGFLHGNQLLVFSGVWCLALARHPP